MRNAIPEKEAAIDATGGRGRSILLAVVAIGLAVCVEASIVWTRGECHKMIAELDIRVSPVTSFALGPVLPIVLGVIIPVTLAKQWNPRFGFVANVWNGTVVCLALASLALYLVGVFAPLITEP